MKLSPVAYYSDFFAYPILIAILAGVALSDATARAAGWWVAAFAISVAAWTLLEYALHRVVFHHFPIVRAMHDEHHVHETASTGTPLWISLVAIVALAFLPLWLLGGFPLASAATAGLMSGYLWYVCTHHVLHHWHPEHRGYLYRLKRRHALHHHVDGNSNFGVTTGFWDRVSARLTSGREAPKAVPVCELSQSTIPAVVARPPFQTLRAAVAAPETRCSQHR